MIFDALFLSLQDLLIGLGIAGLIAFLLLWIACIERRGPSLRPKRKPELGSFYREALAVKDKTRRGPEPHLGKRRVGL